MTRLWADFWLSPLKAQHSFQHYVVRIKVISNIYVANKFLFSVIRTQHAVPELIF